jgi:5-methylcytosine-specific restriction endonuclease McrA
MATSRNRTRWLVVVLSVFAACAATILLLVSAHAGTSPAEPEGTTKSAKTAVANTAAPAKPAPVLKSTTCLDCHSALDGPLGIKPDHYNDDIHAQKGLTCADCHGGDPNEASPDAMAKKAGFKGHIDRKNVPQLCASCHANSAYMRTFNPSLRTDQYAQYQTSVHGKQFAKGDTNVAVCTDCHGVHGIRPASDTRSRVNPMNVAETCSSCHSDKEHMKPYKISTDQFAGYSASVHRAAMVDRGDMSAPTCTTCHGNHGAAPPGVASVENVCSTCHLFQAQLFDSGPHKAALGAAGLPGCITCHSNHRIQHPSDKMVGTNAEAVCTNCHAQGDAGYKAAAGIKQSFTDLDAQIAATDEMLHRAESKGVEVSEPLLKQTEARDWLTKARVTLHSFRPERIAEDVKAGRKIADANRETGVQALRESDYRRRGLAVSLLTIFAFTLGLFFWIKEIERKKK